MPFHTVFLESTLVFPIPVPVPVQSLAFFHGIPLPPGSLPPSSGGRVGAYGRALLPVQSIRSAIGLCYAICSSPAVSPHTLQVPRGRGLSSAPCSPRTEPRAWHGAGGKQKLSGLSPLLWGWCEPCNGTFCASERVLERDSRQR